MTEVIIALISAASACVCAYISAKAAKEVKRSEEIQKRRIEETKLLLEMLNANSKMTLACITALKNGKANGECEEAQRIYEESHQKYIDFLRDYAIETLI